jgi:hypothetical protein
MVSNLKIEHIDVGRVENYRTVVQFNVRRKAIAVRRRIRHSYIYMDLDLDLVDNAVLQHVECCNTAWSNST